MPKSGSARVMYYFAIAIILSLYAISCTPGSCLDETDSAAKAGFYKTGTGKVITIDTITVSGLGMESTLLYDKALKKTDILLPLNPASETSSFIITTQGITDTVTFEYSSFPHLISKECGYSMFNTIISCTSTKNIIDTVLIQNRDVNTKYYENIKIFL